MYRTLAAVVGIGSLIAMLATASATTITIDSNQDATIYENTANNSNGAGPGMYAGTNAMLSPRRALLGFDIAGNVPAGATIESVQLTLFLGQVAGGRSSNVTIGLHTLMNDWGEGTTGSGSPTIEDTGHGFPANPGDTTWNARFFPATLWETPGGDFDASASATATVGSVINNPYTWLSTAALVSDVQEWLNSPATNFGWILINTDETSSQTYRAFYTRDFSDPTLHPQLQITFAELVPIPEPASLALLGSALISFGIRRRKRA